MKLMWFHLMPYTELPDDFREKHPSVWVDIHSSLFDPRRAHHMYNDFMDELEYAAECGFDAVCVNEHHSNGYGLMPSPNLIASSLARRTTDTAICVMGNSLALYNPPTRVAEEFAMIDVISGGRLIAGFPVGTPMDTCFAYGQNPSMLRERYLEAHDLVMRAWQEQDTFAFNGRFNQQRYVNIWPRPVQKPHPPVWIPGGGSVETWQWCAKMDYVYAYLSYFGFKEGQATMSGFWEEMKRLGKDMNPYRAGFLQFVGVAESREKAMELYREPAEYFYGRCLRVDPSWAMPPGYITEATQRAGIQGQVGRAASLDARQKARATTQMEDIVERGYVIIGSPDEVVEQLTECRDQPQCRAPDAAAAVRQHGQGPGQVQHQAVRRAGPAEAAAAVLRMGGQMVAGADARGRTRRPGPVPGRRDGGGVGSLSRIGPGLPTATRRRRRRLVSADRVLVLYYQPLFRKQIPGGEKHRGDHRPDDQPVDAEYRDAAERGDQHEVIRNFRFAADQDRAQDIIDRADDERTEGEQGDPLPDGSGDQQIEAYRQPDQTGADGRQQRQNRHHGAPQQRSLNPEQPEDQPAERALHDCDDDAALDRGADNGGEPPEQRMLLRDMQRHRVPDASGQRLAVAQQEKQQVQHDKEADDQADRVLPDRERLSRR